MSDKTLRRDVLNAVLEKGVYDNGNVLQKLTDKVDAKGLVGREGIRNALDTLEKTGALGVTRRGSHILKVYPKTKEAHERSERTDRSPGAKRESMFAKGIPAYLPDEMCSPVVVIKKEDRELVTPNDMPAKNDAAKKSDKKEMTVASEEKAVAEPAAETPAPTELSFLELINLAYIGLHDRANPETGELPIGSVHAFIAEDLKKYNLPKHRIKMLNWTLGQLGLRTTTFLGSTAKEGGGRRSPKYQSAVDTTVQEITQEMLDALSAKPVGIDEAEVAPAETSEAAVLPSDLTTRLVKIIKGLEKAKDDLETEHLKTVESLERELREAKAANTELSDELAKLRSMTLDAEAVSLLKKYGV